jgi:hypothetical protein
MQIHFKTTSIPTRAAKRLKRALEMPEATARSWTAFVLGYQDWHELASHVGKHPVSPLDEDCDDRELGARRRFQLSRLKERLREGGYPLSAEDLLREWRPSAARPQVDFAATRATSPTSDPSPDPSRRLREILIALSARPSSLPAYRAELAALLSESNDLRVLGGFSSFALRILQGSGELAEKQAAQQILEVLTTKDLPFAWYNLAVSLQIGDAGVTDARRSIDLLQRVVDSSSATESLRARARSLVANAHATGFGRPVDESEALRGWISAAAGGDLEAAFNAALTLQKRNDPANEQQVIALYRQAAEGGHVYAMTNLGLALLGHGDLGDHLEGEALLKEADRAGDDKAHEALEALNSLFEKKEREVSRALDRGELPPTLVQDLVNDILKVAAKRRGAR